MATAEALATELTELLSVDVSALSPGASAAHMARLERARSQVDAHLLGSLAAFERSGAWEVDAAASVTSWLTAQTGVARPVAGARVRLARYLALMPVTSAALADGDITESHARVLSRCVANPRVRAYFAVEEVELVVDAMEMTADELSRRVDQWIELMDEDGAEPHAPERDVVRANRVGDRVKIDGDLGLETGIPVLAALKERADQLYRRDQEASEANGDDGLKMRTTSERMGEALVELVLAGSGAESNPAHREPLFIVHADEETFRSGVRHPDTLLELIDGTPAALAGPVRQRPLRRATTITGCARRVRTRRSASAAEVRLEADEQPARLRLERLVDLVGEREPHLHHVRPDASHLRLEVSPEVGHLGTQGAAERATASLKVRSALAIDRLGLYASHPDRRPILLLLAAVSLRDDDTGHGGELEGRADDLFLLDLANFEGGLALDYLAERGELLADDERDLLERALEEPRSLPSGPG